MIKSLRWRLQIYYTALLLTVVGGFGSILYLQTRSSKLAEIDGQLQAAAHILDAKLGSFPHFRMVSSDKYRLRVGDYRVIYRFDSGRGEIYLVAVGHRREVYRD